MGNNNTRYITELSDDSSESESDFSIEPRSKVLSRNQLSHDGNIASNICIKDEDNKIIVDGNKDLTTDAAPKTRNSPKPEIVLTLEKVNKIEKELEQYEIISLVYLLYDDVHFALQELTLMLRGAEKQLLSLWVLDQESSHKQWQKKLIEALCIIKNYKILRELGYEKCNLIADLLPHRIQTLSSINKVKKAVYLICEKLDTGKTIMFLQNARLFLESQSESFDSYDYEYLELYFLKWEIIKFASPSDMNNIKKILKVMNEDCLYDMLCDAIPQDVTQVKKTDATQQTCPKDARNVLQSGRPSTSTDTDQHIPKNFDFEMESQILCPPQSLGFEDYQFSPPCVNQPSMSFGQDNVDRTVPDEYRYNIDPENPGVLLIINQENFYTAVGDEFKSLLPQDLHNKLENREGTEKDKRDLKNVFKKFGFKVIVKENLTHIAMLEEIKKAAMDVTNESSFIVCIMSHGDKGVVYGSNSCKVKVSKIQEIMCKTKNKNLEDKPKILILQSCQGKKCLQLDENSEDELEEETHANTTDGGKSIPPTVDMLIFWATIPGYAAIRNKKTGSWFIQALCKHMEEFGNKHHFSDICTRIMNSMSLRKWINQQDHKNVMTPIFESTMRKDFYLPPMKNV